MIAESMREAFAYRGAMDEPRHVEGMHCLRCGYDLNGLPYGPCPECGEVMTEATAVAMHERRVELIAGARDWAKGASLKLGAVAVLYAGGAALVARSARVGLYAGVCILVLVSVGAAFGSCAALLAPAGHRRAAALVWLRTLRALQLPWLVVPLGVPLVLAVRQLELFYELPSHALIEHLPLFGVPALGLVLLLAVYRWCVRWTDATRTIGARTGARCERGVTMAAIATSIGSLVLAFAGWFVVFLGMSGRYGIGN